MMEMNKAQVQMMAEQEAKRRAAADAATAEAAEKVAKLEAEMEAQRKAAAEEAEKNKRFFEEREADMKRQAEALAAQAANVGVATPTTLALKPSSHSSPQTPPTSGPNQQGA